MLFYRIFVVRYLPAMPTKCERAFGPYTAGDVHNLAYFLTKKLSIHAIQSACTHWVFFRGAGPLQHAVEKEGRCAVHCTYYIHY